jgi:kynureninase
VTEPVDPEEPAEARSPPSGPVPHDRDDLTVYTQAPNLLAPHYSRFRVGQRLLLTGHSHQAWPDVAFDGHQEAFEDAALYTDDKWEGAFGRAEAVRDGYRLLLGDLEAEIALAASTHELVVRFLSCLDLRSRPRLVTTDGEFHSLRRQLARLAEEGVGLVRLPAEPVDTLAERMGAATDSGTAAVLVSAVMFETSRIVPGLDRLAEACRDHGAELLVDVYHALGPVPFRVKERGLASAWVTGGGYKYLQLGEGNAFLRVPEHASEVRPVITGWFAEFDQVGGNAPAPESRTAGDADAGDAEDPGDVRPGTVAYPEGAARFAGATYDPTSHYRAARVFDFFAEQNLTPRLLRKLYQHQLGVLAQSFDNLDLAADLVTRDHQAPLESLGGFLALRTPHAGELRAELAERGVMTDSRGPYLRFGPAPYLTDVQLQAAMSVLGECVRGLA